MLYTISRSLKSMSFCNLLALVMSTKEVTILVTVAHSCFNLTFHFCIKKPLCMCLTEQLIAMFHAVRSGNESIHSPTS